ncbi:MAG: DUF1285 domain-containing protein [Pseudomonadales bacterium]|nr:DUF1285 domain-containing protein [Pseudomonadales bacterium]
MASRPLESLFSDLLASQQQSSTYLPPVHRWNPPLSGDIDIVINREGRWIHEGGEIKRAPLVKLFASILVREDDEYFLVTPVEKWRIKVDVAPLLVIAASRESRDGVQAITLTTSTGDVVVVDKAHPLFMSSEGQSLPLLVVRDNIPALIGRNVYYQLVDWALEASDDNAGSEPVYLSSMGEQFLLGLG